MDAHTTTYTTQVNTHSLKSPSNSRNRAAACSGSQPSLPPSAQACAIAADALHAARGDESDGSERGGADDMNDACEVPAAIDAELMGWDTYDDGYVGS